MADDSMTPPVDPDVNPTLTETGGEDAAVDSSFPDPDEFEDGDQLDNATVELPADSYDESAVVPGEAGEGCGVQ